MKKRKILSLIAFLCISFIANAQQKLTSPDNNLVLTFQVALAGAYIYVHVATPIYQATASVVIKDSEGSNKAIDELFQNRKCLLLGRS